MESEAKEWLDVLVIIFNMVGPVVIYFPQYRLMGKTRRVGSFSRLICYILLLSHSLRLIFYIDDRYHYSMFVQSIVTVLVQAMLLYQYLRVREMERAELGGRRSRKDSRKGSIKSIQEETQSLETPSPENGKVLMESEETEEQVKNSNGVDSREEYLVEDFQNSHLSKDHDLYEEETQADTDTEPEQEMISDIVESKDETHTEHELDRVEMGSRSTLQIDSIQDVEHLDQPPMSVKSKMTTEARVKVLSLTYSIKKGYKQDKLEKSKIDLENFKLKKKRLNYKQNFMHKMGKLLTFVTVYLLIFLVFDNKMFTAWTGLFSCLCESLLPVPQFIQNCKRKSLQSLSIFMVVCWFLGDVSKMFFLLDEKQPIQFEMGTANMILFDALILLQFLTYPSSQPASSRIPQN